MLTGFPRGYEEGFTLIELMVVVLVIGILISIALPTFAGARTRAQNRAAQTHVRNGLVAGKTYYSDKATYTDFDLYAASIEPSITYVTEVASLPQDGKTVAIVQDAGDDVLLVTWSVSGTYFGLADDVPTGTTKCSSVTMPSWSVTSDCTNGW